MKKYEQFNNSLDPFHEENWIDNQKPRYITVHVFDRDSSANYSENIVFTNDIVEMENRLNEVIDKSGFRKCYFECETTDQFTINEIENLEGIGIEIY
jgi:hypothetical protein